MVARQTRLLFDIALSYDTEEESDYSSVQSSRQARKKRGLQFPALLKTWRTEKAATEMIIESMAPVVGWNHPIHHDVLRLHCLL